MPRVNDTVMTCPTRLPPTVFTIDVVAMLDVITERVAVVLT